jgi:hypothetical protein
VRVRDSHYRKNPLGENAYLSTFKGIFSFGIFAKQSHLQYLENIALFPLTLVRNLFASFHFKENPRF